MLQTSAFSAHMLSCSQQTMQQMMHGKHSNASNLGQVVLAVDEQKMLLLGAVSG